MYTLSRFLNQKSFRAQSIKINGGYRMNAKTLTAFLVGACLMAGTQSLWGQNTSVTPGSQTSPERRDQLLRARAAQGASAEQPAAKTYTGTFVFNFTITVSADISSTAKIACQATAIVNDGAGTATENYITEQATVIATRSGSTATCSPTIPYSWILNTESTDTVVLAYAISAPSEASTSAQLPSRYSSQNNFADISVPATGTTTTETLTPTF
jgi:hypothetical protein